MEHWDIATVDIAGEFMQEDIDEKVIHLQLDGRIAELLVQKAPNLYCKFIQIQKNKPLLYMKLRKALQDTLRAEYLYSKRLSD